jgi:hypothetical protein
MTFRAKPVNKKVLPQYIRGCNYLSELKPSNRNLFFV